MDPFFDWRRTGKPESSLALVGYKVGVDLAGDRLLDAPTPLTVQYGLDLMPLHSELGLARRIEADVRARMQTAMAAYERDLFFGPAPRPRGSARDEAAQKLVNEMRWSPFYFPGDVV